MSGLRISAVLRYGVGADGSFRFERSIVWPMLRTIPNNTHGSLMRRFAWDVPLMLSVNENCLQQEKVRRIVLDGTMTVESDWTAVKGSLSLTRVLFPSVDEAAFCEKYILKNTGEKPLYVEIPRARSVIRTAPAKGARRLAGILRRKFGCIGMQLTWRRRNCARMCTRKPRQSAG